jgi:spermidine/putrescine-binding protein
MMMWRRRRAAIAVLATAAAVLAACSSSGNSNSSGGGPTSVGNSSAPPVTTPTTAPGGSASAVAVSDIPGWSSLKGKTLVEGNWGGALDTAEQKMTTPFGKAAGVTVKFTDSGTGPEALGILQEQNHDVSLDIVSGATPQSELGGDLAPFPSWLKAIFAKYMVAGSWDNYILNSGQTADLIACNPAVMKKCPQNLQQFWDVKDFPGPRAVDGTSPTLMMPMAEEEAGVPKDKLWPLNVSLAVKSLQQLKPNVQVFTSSGSQMEQVLDDKEVGAEILWNGRAYVVKHSQIPNLQLIWSGCQVSGIGGYGVLKDAPDKDVAFAYLGYMAEHPELQAQYVEAIDYPTPAKNLLSLLPKDVAAALPTGQNCAVEDATWYTKNSKSIEQAWQQFLTG